MTDYRDDSQTEGPEGYFIQTPARPRTAAPRAAELDRRRTAGRRTQDAEIRRASKRLTLMNATLGAILAAGLVLLATDKLE